MRVHFLHWHFLDTVIILEEGNRPHPRCPQCDLNGRHPDTTKCTLGAERKRRRLAEEEFRKRTDRAFEAYGAPFENVTAFNFLGWVLTTGYDDWTAVVGNLCKARKIWGQLLQILIQEGRIRRCRDIFKGGDAGGLVVWGGDVGTNPQDEAAPQ